MKQFAIFNYLFAVICLIAAIVVFFAIAEGGKMFAAFILLAAIAYAISGVIVQKANPDIFKK